VKKTRLALWAALVVLAGLAVAALLPEAFPYPELKVFSQAYMLILTKYVDPVKDDGLLLGAERGLLNSLDPFSFIIPAGKMADFGKYLEDQPPLDAGVMLRKSGRVIYAMKVFPGGAASEVLKEGDVVEEVDGLRYPLADVWEMQRALAGPLGKNIKILYSPRDAEKSLDAVLKLKPYARPQVAVKTVEGAPIILLPDFREESLKKLKEALATVKTADLLFVDLRGNTSFAYEDALKAASLFAKEELTLAFKTKKDERKVARKGEGLCKAKDLVLIIDRDTTGAPEIFASLLQKSKRARALGRATYGYTGIQKVVTLSDGSACYLTTTIAGLPKAESLMHKGVQPDILVKESGAFDREGNAIDKKVQDFIREKTQKKAA
jgi:carboxyl-terminal processing protease